MRFSKNIGALLLLCLVGSLGKAFAQEEEDRIAEALQFTRDAANTYEFSLGDQPDNLELKPEPILRWSNPEAGEIHGNVFLWTHEGRPQVVASLFQWYSPYTHGAHEFHSLATQPIRGWQDGQPVWNSPQAGVEFRTVPEQSAVAKSELGRLRQMRFIARQFTVEKTDREGLSREMRLLSQPIYRYPNGRRDILDGALFVFVQGTDPEVFLLLEARQAEDIWQWHYALARMNSVQFVAQYQDREVWRVELWPWSKVKNGRETYIQFGPIRHGESVSE